MLQEVRNVQLDVDKPPSKFRSFELELDKHQSTPPITQKITKSSKRISEEKLKSSRRCIPHWISANSSFSVRKTPTPLKRKPSWCKNLSLQAETAKERVPYFKSLKQKQYMFRKNVLPKQEEDPKAISFGYSVRLSQIGGFTDARKRAKSTNPIVDLYEKLRPLFNRPQLKTKKGPLHSSMPKVPHMPVPMAGTGHHRKISADAW